MKLGIILNSNNPETAWNALRFGVTALTQGHAVKVFLMGSGVEIEVNDGRFHVKKQLNRLLDLNGVVLSCGTCLKIRNKEDSQLCPISSMNDLLKIVEESDRTVTFS